MSLKELFGLSEEDISESEIVAKLKQAQKNNSDTIQFTKKDGSKITIEFPSIDFNRVITFGE